jgi:hypothetical protein
MEAPQWLVIVLIFVVVLIAVNLILTSFYKKANIYLVIFVLLLAHFYARVTHANKFIFRATLLHYFCCMLVHFTSTLLVRKINPSLTNDFEINILTERHRLKYSLSSILYLGFVCTALYTLSLGFSNWGWIYFYIYASILAFRMLTFLQASVPVNMKPFPYLNKNSSALMVFCTLWGLEMSQVKLPFMLLCIAIIQSLQIARIVFCLDSIETSYFDQMTNEF